MQYVQEKQGQVNTVLDELKSIYHSLQGKALSGTESELILRSLLGVRDVSSVILKQPKTLFQCLFSDSSYHGKIYYPCDILEIRSILEKQKITSIRDIVFFSNKAWKDVIKTQKAILVINKDPSDIGLRVFGGIAISEKNSVDINDSIDSIILQRGGGYDALERIVSDTLPGLPIYDIAYIPQITNEKFASKKTKFIVDLPAVGINKQKITATSPKDALEIALIRRWSRDPAKKVSKNRPPRMTADYWYNSGFFDSIVSVSKEASLNIEQSSGKLDPLKTIVSDAQIRAVMTSNGDVFFDVDADNHSDVIYSNGIDYKSVISNGFISKGAYKPNLQKDFNKVAEQSPPISLTEQERNIFSAILDVAKTYGLKTQFRVAGGWVRDKILGKPSDDIDVALDDITGRQFYEYCSRYAREKNNPIIGKSYLVEQNPDKSKHLETVAIEIGGLKVDFVNLRTESYGSDSRIPTSSFGDPETDARRRDLTINALFYNIGNGQIEDYVGGLNDIKSLILRTPMDPKKTFLDDPLRMLRVLRFYSRYNGSKIDPSIIQAMADPQVQQSYKTKIASERAGPEIMKLFAGDNPVKALEVLYDTGLDNAIMNTPEFASLHPFGIDQQNEHHDFTVKDHTFKVMEHYVKMLNEQMAMGNISEKDRMLAMIACWFHDKGKLDPVIRQPHENKPGQFKYPGHEDKSAELADVFLKNIGIGSDDREFVTTIVREHMLPHMHHGESFNKKMKGKLRTKTTIPGQERNDIWKFVLWHAQADDAGKSSAINANSQKRYSEMFSEMNEYMSAPPPEKPLIDGLEIIKLYPDIHPKTGFIPYIQNKLKEMQSQGDKNQPPSVDNIVDKASALSFVQSLSGEIYSNFPRNKGNDMQKPASNWYSKKKIATALGEGISEFVNNKDSSMDDMEGIERMVYQEPGKMSQFQKGKRIKDKNGRLGSVVSVKSNNSVTVKWDGERGTDTYDLSDAPAVFMLA